VIHIQIAPKDIPDKPTRPGIRMEAFAMSLAMAMILWPVPTNAELVSDSGATDIEIRIGNIMPYTGPLAAFSTMGRAEAAYFDMVNDNGGLNGRKVKSAGLICAARMARPGASIRGPARQAKSRIMRSSAGRRCWKIRVVVGRGN
jgi:hypothetical protein